MSSPLAATSVQIRTWTLLPWNSFMILDLRFWVSPPWIATASILFFFRFFSTKSTFLLVLQNTMTRFDFSFFNRWTSRENFMLFGVS